MITQDDLQGHWRRDWIKTPGFEDHTTRVHWMQSGALFADVRIPFDRPDLRGVSSLAELSLPSLRPLLNAEGFAGQITVENSQCTWHRAINWHGVPGQPDIGLMSFDESGGLIEEGVLSELTELWLPVPQSDLRGVKVRAGDMTGVLVETDEVFLLGIGPTPSDNTEELVKACDAGTRPEAELHALFESEYVLGTWDGPFGVAQLSTNPLHEGEVALERKAGIIWHALAFDGRETARPLVLD